MKKPFAVLVVAATLAALPVLALAKPTNQVLVLTTATRVDTAAFYARAGLVIQNNGPNAIYCAVGETTGLAVGYGFKLAPGDTWSLPLRQNIPVWCLAATANQVAGAATDVTEL